MSESLEDQRDFLLRSLEDLEREHDAGDIAEDDYQALKDDYTARAAIVLRALDGGGRARRRSSAGGARGRGLAVAAGVLVFALAAGILLAQSSGRRQAGESATGDIRQTITQRLNEAGSLASQGDYEEAVALYDDVLADDPSNAEAATYKGWILTLAGDEEDGLSQLLVAATEHPDYPDAHAFLAILFFRNGLVDQAARELDRLDALHPPAEVRELVAQLRAAIEAAQATATSSG